MNDSELRIKKTWLSILFLMPIFYLVSSMDFTANYAKTVPSDLGAQAAVMKGIPLFAENITRFFLRALINVPVMFYYSYKKHGTALLFLSVLEGILFIILSLFDIPQIHQMFTDLSALQNSSDASAKWVASFIKFALFYRFLRLLIIIVWSVYCYKLRLLNFKLGFNKVMTNETYRNVFVDLEKISESKTLDDFYGKNVREYPKIEKFLTKKYKKKKSELNNLETN